MSVASLTPVRLARVLKHVGPKPAAAASTFHGTKVIVLASDGTRYYITAARPHRLIHVSGHSGQALAGAPDPDALVNTGAEKYVDCNSLARCGVAGNARVTSSGPHDFATSPIMITMMVLFSAIENGKPVTSCSVTAPVPSAAVLRPVCEVHGPAWSHFASSHEEFWSRAVYTVEVNSASAISALQSRLSQEQGAS